MDPVAIVAIAVGVGVVVYALSLWSGTDEALALGHVPEATTRLRRPRRRGRPRAQGFEPPESVARSTATAEGASESFTYVPVGPAGRTPWTRRLTGFLGLLALIAGSAAVLAGALYEAGHLINQMIARYLEK